MILKHNTSAINADSIIKNRKILARVQRGREWTYLGGPFFFVGGQTGTEVPSGGSFHDANLYFECKLEEFKKTRSHINGMIIRQSFEELRGKVLVYENDADNSKVEQAVIMPVQEACLRLIKYEEINSNKIIKEINFENKNIYIDVDMMRY